MAITPQRPKWQSILTDRERFNRQMHYLPVDRCVNREFGFWAENFEQWPIFKENGITGNGQVDAFFNFDSMAGVGGAIWMLPPLEQIVLEEREQTRIVRDANGLICEIPKDGHSTIPHYLRSTIETPDDWKRMKKEHFDPDHPGRKVDVEALKKRFPPDRDFPVGVYCGSMIGRIRDLLTIEGLSYAVYDYPAMVEDMVETACVLVETFLDQVLGQIDFDFASGWEDICFNHGPLLSLDFFRNIVAPRYKRIGDRLHAHGIDIWYTDCDGDVRPLIPIFLECGINTMFPYEVHCSAHPGEVLDEFGKDLRILGGVDKMVLKQGREPIRRYLESIAPWVERGGFIPHCDHRCPPDVDWRDYLYYLDLKEAMFGIPSPLPADGASGPVVRVRPAPAAPGKASLQSET